MPTDNLQISLAMSKIHAYYFGHKANKTLMQHLHMTECHEYIDDTVISRFAEIFSLRCKPIKFESTWWQYDSDALLLVDKTGQLWVLLPAKFGKAYIYHPDTKQKQKVTKKLAHMFDDKAYAFYPTLPNTRITWRQLLPFAWRRQGGDLMTLLFTELPLALLALLFPYALGWLLENLVVKNSFALLGHASTMLLLAVFAGMLFYYSQLISSLRLTLKMDYRAQSAIWDRVLRLPLAFFRRFNTGDLVNRIHGMADIQQLMGATLITTLTNSMVLIFALLFMVFYSIPLTLVALGFMLLLASIVSIMLFIQLKYEQKIMRLFGKIDALLLQMITGISKIRLSASKLIFFERWFTLFNKTYHKIFSTSRLSVYINCFYLLMGPLITLCFYLLMATKLKNLTLGDFIAFSIAYGQLFIAINNLLTIASNMMATVPLYQRISPILLAQPESDIHKKTIENLQGHIEVKNVCFKYPDSDRYILEQCHLTILPRQHIAIVAASGQGKSTLLRLLLGLESPESGLITYDSVNLRELNHSKLRQQFGVVLQNNRLMAGTIADNISGFRVMPQDALWEAAEKMGIASDIQAMPMGMQSFVDENGSLFSAGQRQRILLARAICAKPKILFLDEATSALDNVTQAHIQTELDKLNITRISIAHRIHTLKHADIIYVLDRGRIVEQGSYHELLATTHGLFRQYAGKDTTTQR